MTIAGVNDIAVDTPHRQRGVGTAILEHVEALVRERGAHLLRSETGIENIASQKLHARLGFRPYRIEYEKVLA